MHSENGEPRGQHEDVQVDHIYQLTGNLLRRATAHLSETEALIKKANRLILISKICVGLSVIFLIISAWALLKGLLR